MRAIVLLALVALLAPTAAAHVDRDRYSLQPGQVERDVSLTHSGTTARVELLSGRDPLRDLVRHTIDPARGIFESEYREHPSDAASGFAARWTILRLVEYGDLNDDGQYQPGLDPVVRSWRPGGYEWNVTPPRRVFIGGVIGDDMAWNGTAAGAPNVRLELGASGRAMQDEGARVKPQDVILYLDIEGFPPRGVGNLYAIEGQLAPPTGAAVRFDPAVVENRTIPAGIVVESPGRLAVLDWGAQATVDGVEEFLNATIGDAEPSGNRTFLLHLPRFDASLRMVLVSAVEYVNATKRGPGFEAAWVALAVGVVALAGRFRRAR